MKQFQAFIFDMDNTLLQSRIDFYTLKRTVFEFLAKEGILSADYAWPGQTASQIIQEARSHDGFPGIEHKVWQLVEKVESEGMQGAKLEPNATQLLQHLRGKNKWVSVLTNNAYSAAEKALKDLSVHHLFDYIAGREQMEELKPSPSGVLHILQRGGSIPREQWVMVGDSWIDGMAAQQAGIPFIAYQADVKELGEKGVQPLAAIHSLHQLEQWS